MNAKWRLLGRHRWVAGAVISESCMTGVVDREDPRGFQYSFTATVRGFRNWKIYRGPVNPEVLRYVIGRVREIRDRIDSGKPEVFDEPNEFRREIDAGEQIY